MSHFRLDVDPDAVERSAQRLARSGQSLDELAGVLTRAGIQAAQGWRGEAANSATAELEGLGRELAASAPHFAATQEALAALASGYREAELTILGLNRRWEQAEAACVAALVRADQRQTTAVVAVPSGLAPEARRLMLDEASRANDQASAAARAALVDEQRRLEAEFDELRGELLRATTRAGAAAAAATVVPVPGATLQLAVLTRLFGGLFGMSYPLVAVGASYAGTLPLAALYRQLADPPRDVAGLQALLDRARAAGLTPVDYQSALRKYWAAQAFLRAGIDPDLWDPSLGAEANREIIEKVYAYYGRLFLDNPFMQWAGMANMIGPSFAAGFFDLGTIQRYADLYARTGAPGMPPGMSELARMGAADIRYYESTFLQMQRQIFLDQAPMHEAYASGGLAAIRELAAAGIIDARTMAAWVDIDAGRRSGDATLIERGNTVLLAREQFEIIAESYDQMRAHPVTGEALTFMMTLVGGPSIPGAQSYPEVFPLTVSQSTPGPDRIGTPQSIFGVNVPSVIVDNPIQGTVHIQTPLPDGNIADRRQRWALIEQDTLPAFQAMLREDPQRARELIGQPVAERIDEQHLYALPRVLEDVDHILTDWDVEFEQ